MSRIAILDPAQREPFPPVEAALAEPNGLLAAGGDLSPERLLDAYAHGIFPWFNEDQPILWWSPDPRMVFETSRMHVPRRLRRWLRTCRWTVGADRAFGDVVQACAGSRHGHDGTWITPAMHAAYVRLHELGHAHSIEVRDQGELVGGIYGIARGRMFFGESMFSRRDHASKVALLALAHGLARNGFPLLDAQVDSAHLRTLGAFAMPRRAFAARIAGLVAEPACAGDWNTLFATIEPRRLAAGGDDAGGDPAPACHAGPSIV